MADEESEVEFLQDLLGDHGWVDRFSFGVVGVWSRRGGIAVGNITVGGMAIGSMAVGGMSVGSMSVGSIAVGNMAVGAIAVGAIAIGDGNAIGNAVGSSTICANTTLRRAA